MEYDGNFRAGCAQIVVESWTLIRRYCSVPVSGCWHSDDDDAVRPPAADECRGRREPLVLQDLIGE